MEDKIREILFSDIMISGKAIDAIYQATRLEIEKSYAKGLEDGRKI